MDPQRSHDRVRHLVEMEWEHLQQLAEREEALQRGFTRFDDHLW